MTGTLGPEDISTKRQRIAELARKGPEMVFTTLAHHIDLPFLKEAFRLIRKDGAVGVDGQSAQAYAENLDENLKRLLEHFKAGTYKAPPVKRVYLPKPGTTKQRPIGIPTVEDKILQKAVSMLLESVYEQDFLDCSYGFRPRRSAHQALNALRDSQMRMGGGWVIEVDIESFFDSLAHGHLRNILDQRVRDGVIRRSIDKWLKAGVMEAGEFKRNPAGSPQGGVISPLLANIYLHVVMDLWFERQVKPCLSGEAVMVRFADDIVIVCTHHRDARKIMAVLPKRFEKYGLRLHPEKTRMLRFTRPGRGNPEPDSFDFLGFTHYWGLSLRKKWVIRQKTAKNRLNRALKAVKHWFQANRHMKPQEQVCHLRRKLLGHDSYYGITGNMLSLQRFHRGVELLWYKWLNRRSQRKSMNWTRFQTLLNRSKLPRPRVVHSIYVK